MYRKRMRVGSESALRTRSKQLFGNSYMLEVCLAVSRSEDRFSLSTLADARELAPSFYSRPVARLSQLGLVVAAARVDGDDYRTRWCSRKESALWTAVAEFET